MVQVAKLYNHRLGERSPWTHLLISTSVKLGRDIVHEICTQWGLWAYGGAMLIVVGGYTKVAGDELGALQPTNDVMMLPIEEWALGAEPGRETQFAIESRLRSSPSLCQQVLRACAGLHLPVCAPVAGPFCPIWLCLSLGLFC